MSYLPHSAPSRKVIEDGITSQTDINICMRIIFERYYSLRAFLPILIWTQVKEKFWNSQRSSLKFRIVDHYRIRICYAFF